MIFEQNTFPCPSCGYLVFDKMPGFNQVCPICGWEDCLDQLRFPLMAGSANHVSLQQAQKNYASRGYTEIRRQNEVREPWSDEQRDENWRMLDLSRDNVEEPARGTNYADSYPLEDTTVLYYWRANYWRRVVG